MGEEQMGTEADEPTASAAHSSGKSPRKRLMYAIVVVLVLLSCGIVSFVLGATLVRRGQSYRPPPVVDSDGVVATQKVWVALQSIPRGSGFVEGSLGLRDWPVTNIPPDVIGDISETIGRVSATNIVQGQVIVRGMLMDRSAWSISSPPAIADGVVYFGRYDGALYAVDSKTGNGKWHFYADGPAISTPAVANGVVYFVGGETGSLYAVDAGMGQEMWRFESAKGGGTLNPVAPVVAGGVVYFGSHGDRTLYAVDAETGQEKWHFKINGVVYSTPVVVDGMVYFVSNDGFLYAVDAETGQGKWRLEL
jgi:outer membrane protein assembly factor BamB